MPPVLPPVSSFSAADSLFTLSPNAMPILSNEQTRIAKFKQQMEGIDLLYNQHYRLEDTGKIWQLVFIAPTTAEQYQQAEVILDIILNL